MTDTLSVSCISIYEDYLKKLGLINASMAHDAPSIASQIATLVIFFLPSPGLPDAHCTPPIIIITNDTIRIAVTTIFESHHTS